MFASPSAIPWYRLALQTPLTTLVIFVGVSLDPEGDLSFFAFPDVLVAAGRTVYYLVTDSEGQPLPVAKLTGVTPPKIGKMHGENRGKTQFGARQRRREDRAKRNYEIGREICAHVTTSGCSPRAGSSAGNATYFVLRFGIMTENLKRLRRSFLRKSKAPLQPPLAGFFSPPHVTPLEGLFSCEPFSQSWSLTRFVLTSRFLHNRTRRVLLIFFDLTWLSNPVSYSRYFATVIYFLLFLYAAGVMLPITLPLFAFGHIFAFTLLTRKATHTMAFKLLV